MLRVIRDKIVQRKSVMASDEIDALRCGPGPLTIQIGASRDAFSKLYNGAVVGLDEAADVIAELPIPFLPFILAEAANLV